jgi:phosphatidylserine/phosphatidylglycerophosphate/cardiolipin synthase-like enzyme
MTFSLDRLDIFAPWRRANKKGLGKTPIRCGDSGPALLPYAVPGVFGEEGQILYRLQDQDSGLPVGDTDRVVDWAQDESDIINGRKVQYPGWDIDTYFETLQVTETAALTIAIAPDNAYNLVASEISKAQHSIEIATYSLRHVAIGDALQNALTRGVSVTILIEGGPVGGIDNQENQYTIL